MHLPKTLIGPMIMGALLGVLLLPAWAAAPGEVDWSQYQLLARGTGVPSPEITNGAQAEAMALRAAKMDALRNLLEQIHAIPVSSQTTVRDAAVESDVIQSRLSGIVRNARQIGEPVIGLDGTVTMTFGIPIHGNLADVLLPETGFSSETTAVPAAGGVVTGLVVDVRGLTFMPTLLPRLLDEDGREVYGAQLVPRQYAVETGIAGYTRDGASSAAEDRTGRSPLRIKALRLAADAPSDVIISNADAARIREAAATQSFLSQCRVLFVLS